MRAVARALGLRAEPLTQAVDGWMPQARPSSISHVETLLGSIGGYEVKGYIIHDRGEAVIVDTAYNAEAMLKTLAERRLRLRAICLTHGHSDHADGIEAILKAHPVPVYLGAEDLDLLSWRPAPESLHVPQQGGALQVGALTLRFVPTPAIRLAGSVIRSTRTASRSASWAIRCSPAPSADPIRRAYIRLICNRSASAC